MVAARHFRSPWHTGRNQSAVTVLSRRTPRRVRPIIAEESDMRAHQPGSTPIDIPETVPNPAHTPAPAPAPERPPTRVPEKVPAKEIAPGYCGELSLRRKTAEPTRHAKLCGHHLGAYMNYMVHEDEDVIAGPERMRPARLPQPRIADVRQLADCSAWS